MELNSDVRLVSSDDLVCPDRNVDKLEKLVVPAKPKIQIVRRCRRRSKWRRFLWKVENRRYDRRVIWVVPITVIMTWFCVHGFFTYVGLFDEAVNRNIDEVYVSAGIPATRNGLENERLMALEAKRDAFIGRLQEMAGDGAFDDMGSE